MKEIDIVYIFPLYLKHAFRPMLLHTCIMHYAKPSQFFMSVRLKLKRTTIIIYRKMFVNVLYRSSVLLTLWAKLVTDPMFTVHRKRCYREYDDNIFGVPVYRCIMTTFHNQLTGHVNKYMCTRETDLFLYHARVSVYFTLPR